MTDDGFLSQRDASRFAADALRHATGGGTLPSRVRINIGDTVDVRHPDYPPWFGEVTDEGPTSDRVWVRCIGEPADGRSLLVDVARLTRAGVVGWPWREHDGCDDVDVTGRARPYHRHAANGAAHAHPSGELAHTHQSPEQWVAMSQAAAAAMANKIATSELIHQPDPLVDPVERLAREIATWRYANEGHHRSVTTEDRATAREMLGVATAAPWHLVRYETDVFPGEDVQIAEEWTP